MEVSNEAAKDDMAKKKMYREKLADVGKDKKAGSISFNSQSMIDRIQSKQNKWKVL